MITIITRWESTQLPEQVEWQMWRQLKGAFGVDRLIFVPRVFKMDGYTFDQAETIEDALAMLEPEALQIFLEPKAKRRLRDSVHELSLFDREVAFILGNTAHSNLDHVHGDAEAYCIGTPNDTDLYGINAAAIALAYWTRS